MRHAKIADLKNNLSRYLDHVRGGGTVVVMDRDHPIARLVPIAEATTGPAGDDDRLARLERRGLLRRGDGRLPRWLGRRRPARVQGSVLADVLAAREESW